MKKYICDKCNKEFDTINGCKTHYISVHHPSIEEKQQFFTTLFPPKFCPICGKQILHNPKGSRLFNKTCSKECAIALNIKKQKELYDKYPEKREIKRKQRLKYLSNNDNKINTAWGKRSKRKLSYLEQWFVDNILEIYKDKLSQYDIINEFHVLNYSCDFAFINIKLDVELDGKQHFINSEKRIEHDIKRDTNLINNGWKVYRITYKDVLTKPQSTINEFLNFIEHINILSSKRFDYNLYLENKEYIKTERNKKEQEKKKLKIQEYNQKREILINAVENCNIDFSKFGWRTKFFNYLKMNNYLHIITNHILDAFKLYYNEFFDIYKPKIRKNSKFYNY